jgi:hypothetical protein
MGLFLMARLPGRNDDGQFLAESFLSAGVGVTN